MVCFKNKKGCRFFQRTPGFVYLFQEWFVSRTRRKPGFVYLFQEKKGLFQEQEGLPLAACFKNRELPLKEDKVFFSSVQQGTRCCSRRRRTTRCLCLSKDQVLFSSRRRRKEEPEEKKNQVLFGRTRGRTRNHVVSC